jgi:hypothetical protein
MQQRSGPPEGAQTERSEKKSEARVLAASLAQTVLAG